VAQNGAGWDRIISVQSMVSTPEEDAALADVCHQFEEFAKTGIPGDPIRFLHRASLVGVMSTWPEYNNQLVPPQQVITDAFRARLDQDVTGPLTRPRLIRRYFDLGAF